MPKLKTRTILPTPVGDAAMTPASLTEPGAALFTDAAWVKVKPLARLGRPLGRVTKTQGSLRLDMEVVEMFRASGDGLQTRINDALKSWVRTHV